jgi:hypothetical protein
MLTSTGAAARVGVRARAHNLAARAPYSHRVVQAAAEGRRALLRAPPPLRPRPAGEHMLGSQLGALLGGARPREAARALHACASGRP